MGDEDLNQRTLAWADRINRGEKAYLTPAKLDGRLMVWGAIGAEPTTLADVKELWAAMRTEAESGSTN
tara:strand:+ start:571 stop:774 length:204 start_codon:yes stop_codon:yes gene_type:complete